MESLWIVLRGGCLHFEGGGGFGGRTCWTQARRHHLGGERHTLPGGDPRGGPQSEFLYFHFPNQKHFLACVTMYHAQSRCDCIPILFSSFLFFLLFESIYDAIRSQGFVSVSTLYIFAYFYIFSGIIFGVSGHFHFWLLRSSFDSCFNNWAFS